MSGISRCIALGAPPPAKRVLVVYVDVTESCGPGCQLRPSSGWVHWGKNLSLL